MTEHAEPLTVQGTAQQQDGCNGATQGEKCGRWSQREVGPRCMESLVARRKQSQDFKCNEKPLWSSEWEND